MVSMWTMRELCPVRHMETLRKELKGLYVHLEMAKLLDKPLEITFAEMAIKQREETLAAMENSPVKWRDPVG